MRGRYEGYQGQWDTKTSEVNVYGEGAPPYHCSSRRAHKTKQSHRADRQLSSKGVALEEYIQ